MKTYLIGSILELLVKVLVSRHLFWYCCITNHPKTKGRSNHLHASRISNLSWAGWEGSSLLHTVSAGTGHLEAGGPTAMMAPSHGWQVGSGFWLEAWGEGLARRLGWGTLGSSSHGPLHGCLASMWLGGWVPQVKILNEKKGGGGERERERESQTEVLLLFWSKFASYQHSFHHILFDGCE